MTLPFFVAVDGQKSAADVNNDLKMISGWADQWKKIFNPDPSKNKLSKSFLAEITKKNVHKAFVRPHLNYVHILHDKAYSNAVQEKIESVQYNACLALTGATRGNSKEKQYQELDLESPRQKWWYRKLCTFSKFF